MDVISSPLVDAALPCEDSFLGTKKRRISEKLSVLLLDLVSSISSDEVTAKLRSTTHQTVHSLKAAKEALVLRKPDLLLVFKPSQLHINLGFAELPTVLLVNDSEETISYVDLPDGCDDYILLSEISDPVLRWTEARARRVVRRPTSASKHLAKMLDILSKKDCRGCWVSERGLDSAVYVSDSCARILHRPVEELQKILASPLQHDGFIHPNDVVNYLACMREGLQPGGKTNFECKVLVTGLEAQSMHIHLESHQEAGDKIMHYGLVTLTQMEKTPSDSVVVLKDMSNLEEKCSCPATGLDKIEDDCECYECSEGIPAGIPRRRGSSRSADVDKLIERNRTLEQSLAETLKDNNAKSRLVEFVSHEVRTLMGGITGGVELFDLKGLSKRELQYMNTIKSASDSILRILNDVLTFAKMEAGMLQLCPTAIEFRRFIEEISFAYMSKNTTATLRIEVDDEVPSVLEADAVRLRQVLSNLLNNAFKFTSHGYVSLAVNVVNKEGCKVKLQFSVEDSGVGIPRDALLTLFDPFTQVKDVNSSSRIAQGTGLGLNISNSLVKLMGGSMDVQSASGKGSIFSFVIPVVSYPSFDLDRESSAPANDTTSKSEEPIFTSLKILVADDDELGRTMLQSMLVKLGCKVDVAENGKEAVQRIRRAAVSYDLVLMDCEMPVLDGYSATAEIRKWESTRLAYTKKKTLVYACTAHVLHSNVSRCLEAGMDSYLTKPIRLSDLRNACERAALLKGQA